MSYGCNYEVDLTGNDLGEALRCARSFAASVERVTWHATVRTLRHAEAERLARTLDARVVVHPLLEAPLEVDPPSRRAGPLPAIPEAEYEVALPGDESAPDLLLALAPDEGLELRLEGSRFQRDAWVGTLRVVREDGRLTCRLAAILDHWPEPEARPWLASLLGVAAARLRRVGPGL